MKTEQEFDSIMLRRDDEAKREEQWRMHHSSRQLALDILCAWRELKTQYENEFGECDLSILDLADDFCLSKKEIEQGRLL